MLDDAPVAASKHADSRSQANAAGVQPRGDQLAGGVVTINKPRAELYAFWRDFTRLPSFMDNLERVDVIDALRSHWVAKAPAGRTVEWDAIVTDEQDGHSIAWASTEGADVPNSGRVEFRDVGARGTVVTAAILFDPPGGTIGKLVAKLFQREPAIQVRRDLRRFKQLMETGEVATSRMNHKQIDEEGR